MSVTCFSISCRKAEGGSGPTSVDWTSADNVREVGAYKSQEVTRHLSFRVGEVSALQAQGHLWVPCGRQRWPLPLSLSSVASYGFPPVLGGSGASAWTQRARELGGLLNEWLLLWQVLDGASFVPKDSCKVKRRVRIPDKPNYSLNLWSIMKNCIGRELSRIPMPVSTSGQGSRGSLDVVQHETLGGQGSS